MTIAVGHAGVPPHPSFAIGANKFPAHRAASSPCGHWVSCCALSREDLMRLMKTYAMRALVTGLLWLLLFGANVVEAQVPVCYTPTPPKTIQIFNNTNVSPNPPTRLYPVIEL